MWHSVALDLSVNTNAAVSQCVTLFTSALPCIYCACALMGNCDILHHSYSNGCLSDRQRKQSELVWKAHFTVHSKFWKPCKPLKPLKTKHCVISRLRIVTLAYFSAEYFAQPQMFQMPNLLIRQYVCVTVMKLSICSRSSKTLFSVPSSNRLG